jgi:hypothetical protein
VDQLFTLLGRLEEACVDRVSRGEDREAASQFQDLIRYPVLNLTVYVFSCCFCVCVFEALLVFFVLPVMDRASGLIVRG